MRNNFKTHKLESVQRCYFEGQRRRLLRFRVPSIRCEGQLNVHQIVVVGIAQDIRLFEEETKVRVCRPLLELRVAI